MINVIRNLGGAGGTIIGKALNACGTFVFSETNPRSATILGLELNALVQLRRYAPAHVPLFWRDIDANTIGVPHIFGAFMRDALDDFGAVGRPVVIRDHSYTDFIGLPFVWPAPRESSLNAALEPITKLRDLLVVRHPVSTFRSLRTHPHYHRCLDGPSFVEGALRFLKTFEQAVTIRYEEFVLNPDITLELICNHFEIPYTPEWRQKLRWAVVASGHPKALSSNSIMVPEHNTDDWDNHRLEMKRSKYFSLLMTQSGYPE